MWWLVAERLNADYFFQLFFFPVAAVVGVVIMKEKILPRAQTPTTITNPLIQYDTI